MNGAFFDTNILVYALGVDDKAIRAQSLLADGGIISVQSLNEFATVTRRKLRYEWPAIHDALAALRVLCPHIVPLTDAIHRDGLRIAERYRLSIYDSMIAAAALSAGCDRLWSEDLHHGLVIDGRMEVCNPFL